MPIEANIEVDLGSLLLEKKLITECQLNECIEHQKIKGGYLSQHLIELGCIKDSDLTTCLTCHFGFCYLPLESYTISQDARDSIPIEFICDYCILPIEKNDKLLSVVMADPLNKGVLEILRQLTHCEIVVFISTRREIKQAIERYYSVQFKNFELDQFKDDYVLRDNIDDKLVANGLYTGPSRRRYKRLYADLMGEYFFYPHIIKTKINNVSMSGLLFESNVSIHKGMQLTINVHLDNKKFVTGVVEVARCEAKNLIDAVFHNHNQHFYEVGAFYNFMTIENQNMLADFLRQQLNA